LARDNRKVNAGGDGIPEGYQALWQGKKESGKKTDALTKPSLVGYLHQTSIGIFIMTVSLK